MVLMTLGQAWDGLQGCLHISPECILRAWPNGQAPAFQAEDASSILAARSSFCCRLAQW